MAWNVTGQSFTMTVDDFGVALPIEIDVGADLGAQDTLDFVIKKEVGGDDIIAKTFSGITDNTIELVLTNEDSAKLPVGKYVYRLDWYQAGNFMDNIVEVGEFKVVRKA